MKRIVRSGILAAAVAMSSTAAYGQVFSAAPGLALPDSPAVSHSIVVGGGPASITDLNVCVEISHTFDSDLDVLLQGPGGILTLFNDVGGGGDNFVNTLLDDAGPGVIGATGFNTAPFSGVFRPEGSAQLAAEGAPAATFAPGGTLGNFNGADSNNTWTLWINDDAGGDIGTLNRWSLAFNGAVDADCVPPPPDTNQTINVGALPSNGSMVMFNGDLLNAGVRDFYNFSANGVNSLSEYLNIRTDAGTAGSFDTELGLYDSNGNFVATDDDGSAGLLSMLSYGPNDPFAFLPDTPPGTDGLVLAAGNYTLVVSGFNTVFGATINQITGGTATGTYKVIFNHVPEPGTLSLLVLGGMGLIRRRRA